LRVQDGFDLSRLEPTALYDALDLLGFGAVDHKHAVDLVQPMPALDQQRDDDNPIGRRERGQIGARARADHRVQDGFESLPRQRVREHQRTHGGAIERAIGSEHLLAKLLTNLGHRCAPRGGELVGDLVGIDYPRAKGSEGIGNRGFAATDTPSQAD